MRHIALLLQLIGLALLLLGATADVARTTALLQRSLLLEFAVRHKQIPRLTYFTCRNPATNTNINSNNDTGNRGGNLQQLRELRAAYDAKNVQLIESLYQDKDRVAAAAASNRLFVRIVLLDVLRQPNAKPGRGGQRGGGGGAGGGNRPMAMGARGGGAAAARAEWLDSVLKVEALRQIVAVDLACGMLSRRFLEMVSASLLSLSLLPLQLYLKGFSQDVLQR